MDFYFFFYLFVSRLRGRWVNGIQSILDVQKEEIDSLEKEAWSRQNEPWQRGGGPKWCTGWGKLEDEEEIAAQQSTESGNATGKGCEGSHFSLPLHVFLRSLRNTCAHTEGLPIPNWLYVK